MLREAREETGFLLTSYRLRGIVTFLFNDQEAEYMFLYTADGFTGQPVSCDEGTLEWVPKEEIDRLNLWEGDRIFFRLMDEGGAVLFLKASLLWEPAFGGGLKWRAHGTAGCAG